MYVHIYYYCSVDMYDASLHCNTPAVIIPFKMHNLVILHFLSFLNH